MRLFLIISFSLFITAATHAQTRLQFCVQVDKDGTCVSPAKEFGIGIDGGTLTFMVRNEKGLNDTLIRYKIYYLDNSGNEKLTRTIDQSTKRDWTYGWQDVVFYDAGTYKIKAYSVRNREEDFLYSEILKVYVR